MKYLVRTSYRHTYASRMSQAESIAQDYIAGMIKSGIPDEYIWARIIDMETNRVRMVTLGKGDIRTISDEEKGVVFVVNYSNYLQL